MVGGSTRIPRIEQNIRNKFPNSKIQFDINPDEAVAYGAAIVANAIEVEIIILQIFKQNIPEEKSSSID